jgi:hypothetical protein
MGLTLLAPSKRCALFDSFEHLVPIPDLPETSEVFLPAKLVKPQGTPEERKSSISKFIAESKRRKTTNFEHPENPAAAKRSRLQPPTGEDASGSSSGSRYDVGLFGDQQAATIAVENMDMMMATPTPSFGQVSSVAAPAGVGAGAGAGAQSETPTSETAKDIQRLLIHGDEKTREWLQAQLNKGATVRIKRGRRRFNDDYDKDEVDASYTWSSPTYVYVVLLNGHKVGQIDQVVSRVSTNTHVSIPGQVGWYSSAEAY